MLLSSFPLPRFPIADKDDEDTDDDDDDEGLLVAMSEQLNWLLKFSLSTSSNAEHSTSLSSLSNLSILMVTSVAVVEEDSDNKS